MFLNITKKKARVPKITSPDTKEDVYNPIHRLFGDIRSVEIVARRNWQWYAYICLIIAGVSMFTAYSALRRPAYVPYVISGNVSGKTTVIGIPERLDIKSPTTTPFLQYQLRQFIQATRGVVYDPGYQAKLVTEYVKPYLETGSAANKLVEEFYQINDPFKFAQERKSTIDINIDQPVPQTNSTFELHWFETIKDASGNVISKTEWKGFATVDLHEISIEQMRLNPMGMYITQLTWQNVAGDAAANGVR